MRKLVLICTLIALVPLFAGCGGRLGRNSPVQIRLEAITGNTIDFSNLHLIVSPNGGLATSAGAASAAQTQIWATITTGLSFEEIDFDTTSQQVPFFVYVQNTSGVQEHARLRIFMDGHLNVDTTVTINGGLTPQEATIFRNHLQQP